jgi:hypothetical protein
MSDNKRSYELTDPTVANPSVQPTETYDKKAGRYTDPLATFRAGQGAGQQTTTVQPFSLRGGK